MTDHFLEPLLALWLVEEAAQRGDLLVHVARLRLVAGVRGIVSL